MGTVFESLKSPRKITTAAVEERKTKKNTDKKYPSISNSHFELSSVAQGHRWQDVRQKLSEADK